jgi:glutamate/tyrosine decarboxylase-like PLP-dependent enzyme
VIGGSVATLTALAAARHVKLRDDKQNVVVYCSDQTHSAIDRALMVLGFAPAQLGIITFRYARGNRSAEELEAINQRQVNALITDGFAMISSTTLQGHTALRLCTINPRMSETDIQETLHRLEHFGNNLSLHLNDPDLL